MKLRTGITAVVMLFLATTACQYNKSDILPDCATIPSRFAADVLPLIHAKCATACHNTFTTNNMYCLV